MSGEPSSRVVVSEARLHVLGEVDDDGHRDPYFRRYRYVCRCGRTGVWRESAQMASGDHAVHRSDTKGAA